MQQPSTKPLKKTLKTNKLADKALIKNTQAKATILKHGPSLVNKLESLPSIKSLLATPLGERLNKTKYLLPSVLPFVHNYILKKEGSRVIQLMVKWGDQNVRTQIFDSLKKSWKEMIRGKYAIFVLKQLVRNINIPEIVDEAVTMQGIKEAAVVLDTFIHHTATPAQIDAIKSKFKALAISQDDKQQQVIDNLVIKIIQKEYHNTTISKYILALSLKRLVSNERDNVLQFLQPKCLELIYDQEGLKLFFQIVNYSSTKDRKAIIKLFKPEVTNIMNSAQSLSYLALMKLLHSIDDTVLLQKNIIKDLVEFTPQLYENKKIFNIVYSIFAPLKNNYNLMYKWEPHIDFTTSKKSNEARMGQIRQKFIGLTIAAIKTKTAAEALMDENISKLLLGIVKYVITQNYQAEHFEYIKQLLNTFVADTKKHIKDKQNFAKTSLVCNDHAHRILKTCICLSQQATEEVSSFLNKTISKLQQSLLSNISLAVSSKSSYILIAIIENTNNREMILNMLRSSGVSFSEAVGAKIFEGLL